MLRIFITLLAFYTNFFNPSNAYQSSSPPRALFGFGQTYQDASSQYGLSCSNNAITVDNSIESIEDQSAKASEFFLNRSTTPNGENVKIKCNADNNYYENITLKPEYTITCNNGVWEGLSLCVQKCKFNKDEFQVNEIVQGKDVSDETVVEQFEIVEFDTATSPSKYDSIQKLGSDYYVNVGESVKITCPSTHPPFTSNATDLKYIDINTSSFTTQCKPNNEKDVNKWSNYASCYNGYKPCDNSEVTVKSEGKDIYTDSGEHFKEFGGEKVNPDGKTLHGARLKLACDHYPWYNSYDYTAPICRDGKWTSTEAYCKAHYCTVGDIFNKSKNIEDALPSTSTNHINNYNADERMYYNQTHIFQCKYTNRMGNQNGKAFMCKFDDYGNTTVKTMKQYSQQWYGNFCLSERACRVSSTTSRVGYFFDRRLYTVNPPYTYIDEYEKFVHIDKYPQYFYNGRDKGYYCHGFFSDVKCLQGKVTRNQFFYHSALFGSRGACSSTGGLTLVYTLFTGSETGYYPNRTKSEERYLTITCTPENGCR